MSAWIIRAGHGGVYAEDWLDKGKIGIGWDFGSKDIASMKREQIRATYLAEHPNESKNRVAAIVGQVYRFAHEMTQGQTVVMYDPASRLYHIGVITGDCVPTPTLASCLCQNIFQDIFILLIKIPINIHLRDDPVKQMAKQYRFTSTSSPL